MLAALLNRRRHQSDVRRTARIAQLNDQFRERPYSTPNSRIIFSPGVMALTKADGGQGQLSAALFAKSQLLLLIRDLLPDNVCLTMPERNAGKVVYLGEEVVFFIAYLAQDLYSAASDPSDPNTTIRIMTLRLVSEE
ncbi:DUF3768 domain-containing protein [Sphingomonas sp. TZW2008]|uniref:DUF3768 domain-containing protein n=1 Tax=Sphingomonas sp. TZW2008 TaxID=1917973 RepID=UPI0011819557|nr:DUF3768 domain-containing protein [Sphingomonas sp. TZW2008]